MKGVGPVVRPSSRALNVSAPGPGLGAPALDELLEALGVGLHLVVVDADRRAGLLDEPSGSQSIWIITLAYFVLAELGKLLVNLLEHDDDRPRPPSTAVAVS